MKKILYICCFALLFFGCDNENLNDLVVNDHQAKSSLRGDITSIDKLPEVYDRINLLAEDNKSTLGWMSKSIGESSVLINEYYIPSVVDSVGNITYSLQLSSESFDKRDLYNLIVAERISGREVEPYIMKYTFESEEAKSLYRVSADKKFVGKINVFSISSFLQEYDLLGKNDPSPCFADIDNPNDSTNGDGSSGSGSGGGGGAGSGGSGGGGSSGGPSWATINSWITMPSGSVGSVEVGEGKWGAEASLEKRFVSGKNDDDCPEEDMLIPVNDEELPPPPDCKSFQYSKSTSSWQEAGVKDIFFHVYLIDQNGVKYRFRVFLPHMYFGVPTSDRFGNFFGPGAAAEASAVALGAAMSTTARKYANRYVSSTSEINKFFKDEVKRQIPLHIPGGRASDYVPNVPLIPYNANPISPYGCDD